MTNPAKETSLKNALLAFLITFSITITLFLFQFILKYSEDVFSKNLDAITILKFVTFSLLSLVSVCLPASILISSTMYYRQFYTPAQKKIFIKKSLSIVVSISIFCFVWIAFINPIFNLKVYSLLYDIRHKKANEQLYRTDINLFKGSIILSNYYQLETLKDSLSVILHDEKNKNEEMNKSGLWFLENEVNKIAFEQAKMIGFPFFIFLVFYSGMFLGILNKHNNLIALLTIIYFILLPCIYLLSKWFENLARSSSLQPFLAQLYYLVILTGLVYGLFLYTKKKWRNAY